VTVHLVNDADVAHGLDIHAAELAPNKHFTPVPGKSGLSYTFVANVPGVFLVDCQLTE
jgi:nitrite reductase (NO-forming)